MVFGPQLAGAFMFRLFTLTAFKNFSWLSAARPFHMLETVETEWFCQINVTVHIQILRPGRRTVVLFYNWHDSLRSHHLCEGCPGSWCRWAQINHPMQMRSPVRKNLPRHLLEEPMKLSDKYWCICCSIVQCSMLQFDLVLCHRNKYWQKKKLFKLGCTCSGIQLGAFGWKSD